MWDDKPPFFSAFDALTIDDGGGGTGLPANRFSHSTLTCLLHHRVFDLSDRVKLEAALREVDAVLHIAGPFSTTSKPMADACVRTRTHYLDITGEIDVFEALAARDMEAKKAGIMLLPGVNGAPGRAFYEMRSVGGLTHRRLAFAVSQRLRIADGTGEVDAPKGSPATVKRCSSFSPAICTGSPESRSRSSSLNGQRAINGWNIQWTELRARRAVPARH